MMKSNLKRRSGAMSGSRLAATVRGSAQQIWLAGLGAFSTAREQRDRVFEALVKEGEMIQALTQKAAAARLKQVAVRTAGTRRRLEQVLEESVARSLKRLGVPTTKDIESLSKRVAALTALVDKTSAGATRKRAAAKRAASVRR